MSNQGKIFGYCQLKADLLWYFYSKIMAKVFKKKANNRRNPRPKRNNKEKADLVDPVLYTGGLEEDKYPFLPNSSETKEEEEVENPLNKR